MWAVKRSVVAGEAPDGRTTVHFRFRAEHLARAFPRWFGLSPLVGVRASARA